MLSFCLHFPFYFAPHFRSFFSSSPFFFLYFGVFFPAAEMCETVLCADGMTHIANADRTQCDTSPCSQDQCCTFGLPERFSSQNMRRTIQRVPAFPSFFPSFLPACLFVSHFAAPFPPVASLPALPNTCALVYLFSFSFSFIFSSL